MCEILSGKTKFLPYWLTLCDHLRRVQDGQTPKCFGAKIYVIAYRHFLSFFCHLHFFQLAHYVSSFVRICLIFKNTLCITRSSAMLLITHNHFRDKISVKQFCKNDVIFGGRQGDSTGFKRHNYSLKY